jgi:hypothetical protein
MHTEHTQLDGGGRFVPRHQIVVNSSTGFVTVETGEITNDLSAMLESAISCWSYARRWRFPLFFRSQSRTDPLFVFLGQPY